MIDLDLVVLTFNEEKNIARCIASVDGLVKNVFVVDSGSTDGTVELAREAGATVVEHEFVNQSDQLNWALENVPFSSSWILRLDADEYVTPELHAELHDRLDSFSDDVSGLYIKRRVFFLGRWIKHGGYYPTWLLRIFRTGRARSELAEINEHMVLTEGRTERLEGDIVDDDRKGLKSWIAKHVAYAERHARWLESLRQNTQEVEPRLFGNQVQRRRWINQNIYGRSPLFVRPFLYFFYCYVIRRGFLDGVPGLAFCFLHDLWYRFYVDIKIYELRHARG